MEQPLAAPAAIAGRNKKKSRSADRMGTPLLREMRVKTGGVESIWSAIWTAGSAVTNSVSIGFRRIFLWTH
jgi:hypothetical protein